jgi:hypothetical protein
VFNEVGFEYLIRYRTVRANGRPSDLHWRYFPSPQSAIDFISTFGNPEPPQIINHSVSRRPIGGWQPLTLHDLESLVAENGGER